MSFVVGIDGPAGSGKGTSTKKVARPLGLISIDTGITYRCVALEALNRKVDINDFNAIITIAKEIEIDIQKQDDKDIVFLNGSNVTDAIRSKEVTNIVSPISGIKEVRSIMVELQRKLAEGKDIIAEGRDICTVVFPDADVKIYLDADIDERANRRFKENQEKGIEMTYEEVLKNITDRDYNDTHKEVGSLMITDESIYIDSSSLTIEEVAEKIIDIVNEKRNKK